MTSDVTACLLCGASNVEQGGISDRLMKWVSCPVCGNYRVSREAIEALSSEAWTSVRKAMLSAAVWRSTEQGEVLELLAGNLTDIERRVRPPSSPLTVMRDVMHHVARSANRFTDTVDLGNMNFPRFALRGPNEMAYVRDLLVERDLLREDGRTGRVRISVPGWEYLDRTSLIGPSGRGFVAMWFAEDLDQTWGAAFRPAIEDAGLDAIRVDEIPHNDRIDDVILAEIRRADLLVADFTGQRGGVYFEAGFALGLEKPVIWTCREDWFEEVHFDTRQYNFIVWKEHDDLRERLKARIEALGIVNKRTA